MWINLRERVEIILSTSEVYDSSNMSSLSLQRFTARRNVVVFVFTIFNVGLYGIYVMDIQGDKNGVNLPPRRHFKEASIEQLEHRALSEDNYKRFELQRKLKPTTAQSREIEPVNIIDNTFKSPSLHTDLPRGLPVTQKIHNPMDGSDNSNVSSEYRSNIVKNNKVVGFQQSIQIAQGDWSRSSRVTSQEENNVKENSEIPSGKSAPEKTLDRTKLTSKEQDSSLSKPRSEKNTFQSTLPLENKDPNQKDTSGDIPTPDRSFAKNLVISSSRNPYTNKTLDKSKLLKVASSQENYAEKKLISDTSSFRKDTTLEMNNLGKRTALRTRQSVSNVKSHPEAFSQAQFRNTLKDKTVQEDGRDVVVAPSYSTVVTDPRNITSDGIPNGYYGRKILSSNFTIVYNAVPKCGSRTLQVSITQVKRKRDKRRKQFKNIPPPEHCSTNDGNSSCLYSFYMSMPPSSFVRPHVPYVSLPSNYIMINMLRDPLERFISLFFFRIYGDGNISGLGAKKQHIDDCVESGRRDCDPLVKPSAMMYICGVEPACRENTRWTLEKAKRNIDRYLVVGYLEDIDSMLKVLEVLVPNQLSGLYNEYVRQKSATRRFKTKQKESLSQKTTNILKQKLTLQYEFYNYVRAKFDRLKESLGIH